MFILTALYLLIIRPLELLFEVIFAIADRILPTPGLAIIALSLAMNFLVLPLYRRADAMQEEERRTEERIGPWQKRIRDTFKGDERFMMLQAFYRENNYRPTDALKGSLSLLLEIPFFIAAYRMLSSLKLLQGVKFGPISDLGSPDHMIVIGAVAINLLPILMTLINIISSAIYTKGLPARSKVQLYGIALIFLVLLYNSPAGLVFYWTLNNLFSLVKNIFYKLKKPKLILSVMSALAGIAAAIMTLLKGRDITGHRMALLLIFAALLLVPAVLYKWEDKIPKISSSPVTSDETRVFFLGALFISILTGLLAPSAVLSSSAEEFVSFVFYFDPNRYLLYSGLCALGTFVVWFGFFYILANDQGKRIMGIVSWVLSGIFFADYMFFGTDRGLLTTSLQYEITPEFTVSDQILNIAVLILLAVFLVLVMMHFRKLPLYTLLISVLAVSVISAVNMAETRRQYISCGYATSEDKEIVLPLSREGKNVVVIMMDRAMGSQFPYLLAEKPELMDQFDGFTYYPNTLSFGGFTNFGVPPVFGGYEYTPENMNRRSDELLVDKHNEALLMMPVLFDSYGYEVTVCDPSYAGYKWTPDLRIYNDYPDINAFITSGKFNEDYEAFDLELQANRERNFFLYGLMRVMPLTLAGTVYNNGIYNDADLAAGIHDGGTDVVTTHTAYTPLYAEGYNFDYMNAYTVLTHMNDITEITDSDEDTLLLFTNDSTHELQMLQEPDYVPAPVVDNREYYQDRFNRFDLDGRLMHMDNTNQVVHYQDNMAAMMLLGEWFDYLREQGVYDNTRIIIVSDHGRDLNQFDDIIFFDGDLDVELLNPLLLVKDFDSEGFTVSDEFMTNADVPTIATDGLIADPVNPFTGNPINDDDKYNGDLHVTLSDEFSVVTNSGNTFLPGDWYAVRENIFEEENWEYLGNY